MSRAVLSLGSNLGDRVGHLRAAVAGLADVLLVVSGVYETRPWGERAAGQPPYLNAAVLVARSGDDPRAWLDRAHALEATAGRRRDPAAPGGPRTLDVDVVAVWCDDDSPVLSADPELTLPHPRAHLRAFVLRPWIDIQPYGALPGHGRLDDLLRAPPLCDEVGAVCARPEFELEG